MRKQIAIFFLICTVSTIGNKVFASSNFCYPDGCITYYDHLGVDFEQSIINSHSTVADFVNYFVAPWRNNKIFNGSGVLVGMACGNGSHFEITPTCPNGAINPPSCTQCPSGATMQNNQCVCGNGGTIASQCNSCPTGQTMNNGVCGCGNGAINLPACNICAQGSKMINGQCQTCTLTNVCGQTSQGEWQGESCVAPTDRNINNSCITTFNASNNSVNPNGSVEFSWTIANLQSGIGKRCGFVDLTTPTPRPIPGLQNLDPNQDRARINNVQATTRFCLICQFYNLLNNSSLGNAAAHQWIRVIRVGEN